MRSLESFKTEEYIFCIPQRLTIDSAVIGKLACNLTSHVENVVVHVHRAEQYLPLNVIVDPNGEQVTMLDSNLDKKLVISIPDLNLWYALQQVSFCE